MATKHNNFAILPTGPVDWVAALNDFMNKVEAGPTVKLVAGESLTARKPILIHSDGLAYIAISGEADGVWQSASTAQSVEGYMQRGGVFTYGSWTWTPGGKIYVSGGELTQTPGTNPLGKAISATEIVICPYMRE